MNDLLLARADDPGMDNQSLKGMFRFRHKIFRERMGWEVGSVDGAERDHFDDLAPVYLLARNFRQEIEGSWRLLPTVGPYMLKDTFPQLLRGEAPPEDASIWEISRFAVLNDRDRSRSQANLSAVTFAMFRAGVEFAERHGIRYYVFVTSVAVERLLRIAGIPIKRFGDGRSEMVGHVRSVACWIPINAETRRAVFRPSASPAGQQEAA